MVNSIKILFVTALLVISFSSCKQEAFYKWDDCKAMVKALEWQEDHPIISESPTDWTNGAYYAGVCRAHASTHDEAYLEALVEMGRTNKWQPWERYYHADDLAICSSYLYLKSQGVQDVEVLPTAQIINDHLFKSHQWKHADESSNQRILWWWCDALFMAPPLLVDYANEVNDYTYLDEMHKYYQQTYELLYDKEEHLFARDLRYVCDGEPDLREKNGQKIFWSRGNGWVIGGLALMLDQMPADYQHRPFYEALYTTMASRLKAIQPEDGLWRTSLLHPEAYSHGEVSGSGFYTFSLAWGINNGLLNKEEYLPTVNKAWKALRQCQHADGMVGWVQNIGASPEPATEDSWQNYGTGAFLLAGSEVVKLDVQNTVIAKN